MFYYDTIYQAVDKYIKSQKDVKIGININSDIEMAKFILSADLLIFGADV